MNAELVHHELSKQANPEKAAFFPRFFKSGPGQYGEGDRFLGVVVPKQRKIARQFRELPLSETRKLLYSPWHECRLTALLILVLQFEKARTDEQRKPVYDFYMANLKQVNNWDLVDSSCHKIVGPWLFHRSRKPLYQLAAKKHLWSNRIAIVTNYYFLKRDDFGDLITLSEQLLHHPHDLIHKAIGWMLREAGKKNPGVLYGFLDKHAPEMPRTMLRYAVQRLDQVTKKRYMDSKTHAPRLPRKKK